MKKQHILTNIEKTTYFNHGYSPVKSNGKWGIMDKDGKWYVEPTYEDIVIL
ncbi:MAG: WG repeat-containing protein [Veillonella sp.]|uniref:WG repeat-containing protein n=1 Tax=Veillonella sp. TaxID=1926307 RepID=UPI001B6FAE63|nr:WG repeat-containing protein [Veillonella sp.]MBP6922840.1 WG repeat-containing protein [Veillonella sp.]MBP9550345.1 WG repeat-containing protein [Veillonella sp.]